MNISIGEGKAIDNNLPLFHDFKKQCKLSMEEAYFNQMNSLWQGGNIILNRKKNETFSLRLGASQECLFSVLLFCEVLENIARVMRQEKEIKWVWKGKGEVKFYLFANDAILYIQNLKSPPKLTRVGQWIQQI